MRKLKVYGWTGFESPIPHDWRRQSRNICAAASKAKAREIAKAAGCLTPALSEFTDTGNQVEIQTAMAKPGTIFVTPINRFPNRGEYVEYTGRQ